jgi:hypothetical protein
MEWKRSALRRMGGKESESDSEGKQNETNKHAM